MKPETRSTLTWIVVLILFILIGLIAWGALRAIRDFTGIQSFLLKYKIQIWVFSLVPLLIIVVVIVFGYIFGGLIESDTNASLSISKVAAQLSSYPLRVITFLIGNPIRDSPFPFRGLDIRYLSLFNWIVLSILAVLLIPPTAADEPFVVTNTVLSAIALFLWISMNTITDLGSMLWTRWRINRFLNDQQAPSLRKLLRALALDTLGSLVYLIVAVLATNVSHVLLTKSSWDTVIAPSAIFGNYVLLWGGEKLFFPGKAVSAFTSYLPSVVWFFFLLYGSGMLIGIRLLNLSKKKSALVILIAAIAALLGLIAAVSFG